MYRGNATRDWWTIRICGTVCRRTWKMSAASSSDGLLEAALATLPIEEAIMSTPPEPP